MLKRISLLLFFCFAAILPSRAQEYGAGFFNGRMKIQNGDTIYVFDIPKVKISQRRSDVRRNERLIRNIKKVYPIAKEAQKKLARMEKEVIHIKGAKAQQDYIKKMEKELMREYTPVLKNMTFSQGQVLIKLIDRQTEKSSYAIVSELRGKFRASFWQGIAKIFGADLKQKYDKNGEDKEIEQLIILYEAGML